MSKQLGWLQEEIQAMKEGGLYTEITTISSPQGPWLVIEGKNVLNFCSNNYLRLANHPRLVVRPHPAVIQINSNVAGDVIIPATGDRGRTGVPIVVHLTQAPQGVRIRVEAPLHAPTSRS